MKAAKAVPLRERASCGDCEYGSLTSNSDYLLHCRRHAPVLTNSTGGAVFPVVKEDDWCGDFKSEPS